MDSVFGSLCPSRSVCRNYICIFLLENRVGVMGPLFDGGMGVTLTNCERRERIRWRSTGHHALPECRLISTRWRRQAGGLAGVGSTSLVGVPLAMMDWIADDGLHRWAHALRLGDSTELTFQLHPLFVFFLFTIKSDLSPLNSIVRSCSGGNWMAPTDPSVAVQLRVVGSSNAGNVSRVSFQSELVSWSLKPSQLLSIPCSPTSSSD